MKIWILAFAVIMLSACSVKKKLDSMADTTQKMEKTTVELNEATKDVKSSLGEVNNTSTQIATLTDDLYTGMREVESITTQSEAFDRIKTAPGVMEKAHYALFYFAAMEFQSWQNHYGDDEALRKRMYSRSVEMFFSQILDLVDDSFPIEGNPLGDNNWTVLSVMAMTMAKIHPEQEARAKEKNFKPTTFYDLIQAGLRAKARYEAGEPVEDFEKAVLQNERVARYLLQLRHNFFKALVLGQVSNIEDGWFGGLWNKFNMTCWWCEWTLPLNDIPKAEMEKVNEWLWKAWETQSFLREIGTPIQHNGSISEVFMHSNVVTTEDNWKTSQQDEVLSDTAWTLEQVKAKPVKSFFLTLLQKVLELSPESEPLKITIQ